MLYLIDARVHGAIRILMPLLRETIDRGLKAPSDARTTTLLVAVGCAVMEQFPDDAEDARFNEVVSVHGDVLWC